MNRYFLKVDGQKHCPDGICRPTSSKEWEGGEILLPASGPLMIEQGRSHKAPPIESGDELWIWTHEDDSFGRGWGLTAKAIAGDQREQGGLLSITLNRVERLPRPFGLRDLGDGPTGSRLLDHARAHRHHQAYLIEDTDYPDFIKIVELRSNALPDEVRFGGDTEWDREVRNHKDSLLEGLRNRRHTPQKARPGQKKFRDDLFERHNGRCVLSDCNVPEALEAAHVMPHTGDPVWDQPENGMLLRRDIHALFDAMLWSIDPKSNRVQVAAQLKNTDYDRLHGREVDHKVAPE